MVGVVAVVGLMTGSLEKWQKIICQIFWWLSIFSMAFFDSNVPKDVYHIFSKI